MKDYKIILDLPATNPGLEFSNYATALTEIIESSSAQFAIGIFGGWGSGKTTLMQYIETNLDKTKSIPVRFSAWRYEKEEHLIIPLLDTIRQSLVDWAEANQAVGDSVMETASTIGKVIYSLLAGISMKIGVPKMFEISLDANKAISKAEELSKEEQEAKAPRSFYNACFRALNDAFSQLINKQPDTRIVVFVDDLDRCLPEGALEVLESMKLFFDIEGFVFVVGLDKQVIEAAIDIKYAKDGAKSGQPESRVFRIQGSEYIKKIFQVPFSLLPVNILQIDNLLWSIVQAAGLSDAQKDELNNVVRPHLNYLVTERSVNPREVKRYINAFTLVRKIRSGLDPNVVLALQTIDFRPDWSLIRESLFAYRMIFIKALNEATQAQEYDALENLDPRLRAVPSEFMDYISQTKPAAALLKVQMIDEYLSAGETSRSSSGTMVADIVKKVTEIRPVLKKIVNLTDVKEIEKISQEIESLTVGYLTKADEAGNSFMNSAKRNIEDIIHNVRQLPVEEAEKQNWLNRNNHLITQTVTDLVRNSV